MANIIEAFNIGYMAGNCVKPSDCPDTVWGKWMKAHTDLCEVVRGELMTFVEVCGLAYLSDALKAFKASPEREVMRDLTMNNGKLYVAYSNDFKY